MKAPGAEGQGPEAVVRRLHAALHARQPDAVAACYRADARFQDPVFGALAPGEVRDMWRMLLGRAHDLEVRTVDVASSDGVSASATASFRYTLSWTGRHVHNTIHSAFVVREGRIALQHDDFPFHVWAAQAFGWRGRLLGRSGRLRKRVQQQARVGLQRFQAQATRQARPPADGKEGVPPGRVL
jgi:ketosteroid isomerase-like protein